MSLLKCLKESLEHPMIEINGEMKHRHNSLGIPIHHTDEGIANFHKWFGDSKVVDEHGRPKVVYHGTRSKDNTFKEFDSKFGNPNNDNGHYFSSSADFAKKFGDVRKFYLKIENPLLNGFNGSGAFMSRSEHRDGGIFTKRNTDKYAAKGTKEYIVHAPNQIKNVYNKGGFSKETNNLHESLLDSLKHHINTVTVGNKTRAVVMPSNIRHDSMSIEYVKAKPFDEKFQQEKDFYVGENGLHGIGNRYNRFKEWFHADNDIPMETSKVNVDKHGNVSFDNGRHRYAYLRDNGVKHIPVTMDDVSKQNAMKYGFI